MVAASVGLNIMWTICTILRNRRFKLSICIICLALMPICYMAKSRWWAIACMMGFGLWSLAEIHLDFAVFKRFVAKLRLGRIPCPTCALPLKTAAGQTCPRCHAAVAPEYVRLATGGAHDRAELHFHGPFGQTRDPDRANQTFIEDFVCSGCEYSLQGLASDRCPECGRPFDPADPRSYGPRVREHRWFCGLTNPVQAAVFGAEAATLVVAGQAYGPLFMQGWGELGRLLAILGLLVLFMSWWVRAASDVIACLVPMAVLYGVGYWASGPLALPAHTFERAENSATLILVAGVMCLMGLRPRNAKAAKSGDGGA